MEREIAKTSTEGVGPSDPVYLTLPSSPEYVLLARLVVGQVGRVAGFGAEEVYDLKLAVTEAATNAIRHAAVGEYEIEFRALPGAIEITVTDRGGGFDAASLAPHGDRAEGGFGLAVIRNLVDELAVDSTEGGGTRLRMVRRAGTVSEASGPPGG